MRALSLTLMAGLVTLAACSSNRPTFPAITFNDRPIFRIDAPAPKVEEAYVSPVSDANVEHDMPVRPSDIVRAWVRDRLQPAGARGAFTVTIRRASVTADPIPNKTDHEMRGLKPNTKLSAEVDLDLKYARMDGTTSTTSVHVSRSVVMPKPLSGNDLDRAYYDFAQGLAGDIDKELQIQVAEHMHAALL